MPHDEEDDEAVIILSVTLPGGCVTPLDNLVNAGSYGSSREDVARHFICRALGVDPRPQLPEPPLVVETLENPPVGADDTAGIGVEETVPDMSPESDPGEDAK